MEMINQLVEIAIDLVFRSLHAVPSTGKWTKTNKSCERNMICNLNNLQRGVMAMALGDLSFDVKDDDIVDVFGDSTLHFNKVGSKSSKEATAYYTSADDKTATQILAVVIEGFRFITWVHMSWSTQQKMKVSERSHFQKVGTPSRSPIYETLVHLSITMQASLKEKFKELANASPLGKTKFIANVDMILAFEPLSLMDPLGAEEKEVVYVRLIDAQAQHGDSKAEQSFLWMHVEGEDYSQVLPEVPYSGTVLRLSRDQYIAPYGSSGCGHRTFGILKPHGPIKWMGSAQFFSFLGHTLQ